MGEVNPSVLATNPPSTTWAPSGPFAGANVTQVASCQIGHFLLGGVVPSLNGVFPSLGVFPLLLDFVFFGLLFCNLLSSGRQKDWGCMSMRIMLAVNVFFHDFTQ